MKKGCSRYCCSFLTRARRENHDFNFLLTACALLHALLIAQAPADLPTAEVGHAGELLDLFFSPAAAVVSGALAELLAVVVEREATPLR